MAALMIPGGKLTDRYGRKRCFIVGLVVYGIGALLSAAAPGLGVLIIGNSILALVIAVIVLLSRRLEDPLPPDPERSFDTSGAILSAVGLILLVMGILAADNNLWLTLALLVAGALVLVWFFASVRAKERAGKEPLLSTDLFRNRTSNLGLITQNTQWLMLMGVSFVVSAYLQVVRHYDAIQTGVIFTAATVGLLASSLAAARLAKRYAQRTLILAGFIVTIAGIGVLLAMVTGTSSPSAWAFAPGLLLIGLGLGAMLTPSVNIVQSSFGEEQQGEISGLSRSVSNLGSCLGTAIGRRHHLDPRALLRARDDRFGSGRPRGPGGLGIPARGPCLTGGRAAAAEPAPASRDDVSLPPASCNDTSAGTTESRLRGRTRLNRSYGQFGGQSRG